nr:aspartic proteinase-like protein 2 [Ipomoea batatas]
MGLIAKHGQEAEKSCSNYSCAYKRLSGGRSGGRLNNHNDTFLLFPPSPPQQNGGGNLNSNQRIATTPTTMVLPLFLPNGSSPLASDTKTHPIGTSGTTRLPNARMVSMMVFFFERLMELIDFGSELLRILLVDTGSTTVNNAAIAGGSYGQATTAGHLHLHRRPRSKGEGKRMSPMAAGHTPGEREERRRRLLFWGMMAKEQNAAFHANNEQHGRG